MVGDLIQSWYLILGMLSAPPCLANMELDLYILFLVYLCHLEHFKVIPLCILGMRFLMRMLQFQTCHVGVGLLY